MKKIALTALAASLALAACADSTPDDAEVTAEGDTTIIEPGPTATETTVVTTPGATPAATGDSVSVGPDGVKADVGDEDTRVKVDTDNGTLKVDD